MLLRQEEDLKVLTQVPLDLPPKMLNHIRPGHFIRHFPARLITVDPDHTITAKILIRLQGYLARLQTRHQRLQHRSRLKQPALAGDQLQPGILPGQLFQRRPLPKPGDQLPRRRLRLLPRRRPLLGFRIRRHPQRHHQHIVIQPRIHRPRPLILVIIRQPRLRKLQPGQIFGNQNHPGLVTQPPGLLITPPPLKFRPLPQPHIPRQLPQFQRVPQLFLELLRQLRKLRHRTAALPRPGLNLLRRQRKLAARNHPRRRRVSRRPRRLPAGNQRMRRRRHPAKLLQPPVRPLARQHLARILQRLFPAHRVRHPNPHRVNQLPALRRGQRLTHPSLAQVRQRQGSLFPPEIRRIGICLRCRRRQIRILPRHLPKIPPAPQQRQRLLRAFPRLLPVLPRLDANPPGLKRLNRQKPELVALVVAGNLLVTQKHPLEQLRDQGFAQEMLFQELGLQPPFRRLVQPPPPGLAHKNLQCRQVPGQLLVPADRIGRRIPLRVHHKSRFLPRFRHRPGADAAAIIGGDDIRIPCRQEFRSRQGTARRFRSPSPSQGQAKADSTHELHRSVKPASAHQGGRCF